MKLPSSSRRGGRGQGSASRSHELKVTQDPDGAAMGLGGDGAGRVRAGQDGGCGTRVGDAGGAGSGARRGGAGAIPTPGEDRQEAGGLWMMLRSTMVSAVAWPCQSCPGQPCQTRAPTLVRDAARDSFPTDEQ